MNITKDLPSFQEYGIRELFRKRIRPDMTQEEKDALDTEYKQAIEDGRKQHENGNQTIAEANTAAFLQNPKAVIDELMEAAGRTFELGEMLIFRGIAKVTHKRFGKGVFVGKGTNYGQTKSNYRITVTIGDVTETIEMMSGNERTQLQGMDSYAASKVAIEIATEK
jgi:hypothetical protein